MGRVVRSPEDYGVRILLDSRYQGSQMRKLGKFSVFEYFPPEERREFIDASPRDVGSLVEEFFANITDNPEKKEPEPPASRQLEFGSLAEKL
jgi:DNA excision repair protein ERCC-2